jgi:hypothetical protein
VAKMLQNILLTILIFGLLASPALGSGLNREWRQQRIRQNTVVKDKFDVSIRPFKNRNHRFPVKSRGRARIPRFIAFPFYPGYLGDYYENDGGGTVNIIVVGDKKEEAPGSRAKTDKPVQPPRIVTLNEKEPRNNHKPSGHAYRVVEIRGNKTSVADIAPE